MAEVTRLVVSVASGYASTEIASFIAQLDDQTRRLREGTRGLTAADLAWQPARGMNTIGMLLAHLAVVEVWWTGLIPEDLTPDQVRFGGILGITGDDDGMPLAEKSAPPAVLAGKDLAFFDDLLDRAREHLKQVAAGVPGSDLTRTYTRTRPNGEVREVEMRWAFYHMLEHFAGHFGQILMLRHARRAMSGGGAKSRASSAPKPRPAKSRRKPARPAAGKAARAARPKPSRAVASSTGGAKSSRRATKPARPRRSPARSGSRLKKIRRGR